jgi:hypothetical protein
MAMGAEVEIEVVAEGVVDSGIMMEGCTRRLRA